MEKFKKVRTEKQILDDPRVSSLSYEGEDGWWLCLTEDYVWAPEQHIAHTEFLWEMCELMNYHVYRKPKVE
jgi:hypothetical protein